MMTTSGGWCSAPRRARTTITSLQTTTRATLSAMMMSSAQRTGTTTTGDPPGPSLRSFCSNEKCFYNHIFIDSVAELLVDIHLNNVHNYAATHHLCLSFKRDIGLGER